MKTDNELIAEFMGSRTGCDSYGTDQVFIKGAPKRHLYSKAKTAKYDKSWDWLMPAVLKSKKTPNSAEWNWDILNMYLMRCDLDGVFKELGEFIKWYNQQPK